MRNTRAALLGEPASALASDTQDLPRLTARVRLCFGLALVLLLTSFQPAAPEAKQKPRVFGRYELVKGQDNPVCLAVGEQVKAYKRVPSKFRPHQKGYWGIDFKAGKTYDFRCDFPLESRNGIRVPGWRSFDPTASQANSLLASQIVNDFFGRVKPTDWKVHPDDLSPDESVALELAANRHLLEQMFAWGITEFQTARIDMQDFGPVEIYRFSHPRNTLQACWMIGVGADSPLYRLRYITFEIRQVFQFGAETYYLTGLTPVSEDIALGDIDIRIASFDRLARLDLRADSQDYEKMQIMAYPYYDFTDPNNTCQFKLRGGEKSTNMSYSSDDVVNPVKNAEGAK